jgi:hypothetical protein
VQLKYEQVEIDIHILEHEGPSLIIISGWQEVLVSRQFWQQLQ